MTMSQTLITSRDPKGLHAVGLFEAVYNKSKLDEARAQRLNERGGELQDGIAKLIAELSVSNQYANEEVRSSYTYPKEYKGPKPIANQIKALAKIFDLDPSHATKFADSQSFYNYREGQITPAQLRVHARTAHALDLIAETQKGDILIVAAQLGMRHRGKSVRRAREVFVGSEFGLGSLAVGSIVLTHPERLAPWVGLVTGFS